MRLALQAFQLFEALAQPLIGGPRAASRQAHGQALHVFQQFGVQRLIGPSGVAGAAVQRRAAPAVQGNDERKHQQQGHADAPVQRQQRQRRHGRGDDGAQDQVDHGQRVIHLFVDPAQQLGGDAAGTLRLQRFERHAAQLLAQAHAQFVGGAGHVAAIVEALRAPAQRGRGQGQHGEGREPGGRGRPRVAMGDMEEQRRDAGQGQALEHGGQRQ